MVGMAAGKALSLEFSGKRSQGRDMNRGAFEDTRALHSHAPELYPHGTEEAGKSRAGDNTQLRAKQNVENVHGERGVG